MRNELRAIIVGLVVVVVVEIMVVDVVVEEIMAEAMVVEAMVEDEMVVGEILNDKNVRNGHVVVVAFPTLWIGSIVDVAVLPKLLLK